MDYVAILIENKIDQSLEVPDEVIQILKEFKDWMLVEINEKKKKYCLVK